MQKPHLLLTVLLGITLVFHSCTKEEVKPENEIGLSEYIDEYEGQFKREFTVSDKNGNTAFYAAYSKDEEMLNNFVNNTKFTLTTNDVDIESMKNKLRPDHNKNKVKQNHDEEDDGITIELITSNVKKGITNFSLNIIEPTQKTSKRYITRTFKTSKAFMAIRNTGSSMFLEKVGTTKCLLCTFKWETYYNDFYSNYSDWIFDNKNDYYRVGIKIMYSTGDNISYSITYNDNEYRGDYCTIGNWNGGYGCYVGTAPSGTTAFMYPNKFGNFYYTKVSTGTTCPYPGSWYDGANCYVCDIPDNTTTYGYISLNRWYIKSELE